MAKKQTTAVPPLEPQHELTEVKMLGARRNPILRQGMMVSCPAHYSPSLRVTVPLRRGVVKRLYTQGDNPRVLVETTNGYTFALELIRLSRAKAGTRDVDEPVSVPPRRHTNGASAALAAADEETSIAANGSKEKVMATKKTARKAAAPKGRAASTIKDFVNRLLKQKRGDETIIGEVKKEFPASKFNKNPKGHLAWYKTKLHA